MTRTKPAEQRRADLLAAGRAVFMAKGVTAATMEDITTAAGVSKGLFWQYFRSKEDLVVALQAQYSQRFADAVVAATDAATDWPAKLDACVQACFDQFHAELDLHDVLFRHAGAHQHDPDQPPAHHVLVEAIAALLAAGTAAGAYQVDDPHTMATLFYATMHAFDPALQVDADPGVQLAAAQRLFRRGVGLADTARS